VAGELGFAVEFADLGATNGCTEFGPDKITINPDRDRVHQCKTMAHELGHAILHRDADYAAERGRCELEAESVAYVVLGALDTPVDTSAYSFGYVAHWQQAGARDAGKVGEAIESSGKAVQKAARQILDLLARTA
jgi:hypothetical protein